MCMTCGAGESCCTKNANSVMCFAAPMTCH
jgi:hypothetical protein